MKGLIEKLSNFTTRELKQEIKRRKVIEKLDLINKTFEVVCKHYKVTEKAVMYKGEKGFARGAGPVRNAKRALMYIFHHEQGNTAVETGNIMGKEHSTCTVSSNKVKDEIEVNPNYKKEITFLIEQIKNSEGFDAL